MKKFIAIILSEMLRELSKVTDISATSAALRIS